jgi:mannose-6-phosphate isomerase-like protein (cupin superfamily)
VLCKVLNACLYKGICDVTNDSKGGNYDVFVKLVKTASKGKQVKHMKVNPKVKGNTRSTQCIILEGSGTLQSGHRCVN